MEKSREKSVEKSRNESKTESSTESKPSSAKDESSAVSELPEQCPPTTVSHNIRGGAGLDRIKHRVSCRVFRKLNHGVKYGFKIGGNVRISWRTGFWTER